MCFDAEIDTCILPCRHSCLCAACLRAVRESRPRCPICRGPLTSHLTGSFDSEYVALGTEARRTHHAVRNTQFFPSSLQGHPGRGSPQGYPFTSASIEPKSTK